MGLPQAGKYLLLQAPRDQSRGYFGRTPMLLSQQETYRERSVKEARNSIPWFAEYFFSDLKTALGKPRAIKLYWKPREDA